MEKHKQTVRLTIDVPVGLHTYIKMLAAKEGVSLRQFVIEHLPGIEKKKKTDTIPQDEFEKALKKLLLEKADLLRRLSKR